ncbi:MAG: hypothetical protein OXT67_13430 [Zetaproteobacteria bacterium]|nr:hypothetical protein [Zetaproteobacteria bacterium]
MKVIQLYTMLSTILWSAWAHAGSSSTTIDAENIAQLISTTPLEQFHPMDRHTAQKLQALLDTTRTGTPEFCMVDLSETQTCQICLDEENMQSSVPFDCAHHYHPECLLNGLAASLKNSADKPGFACLQPGCDGIVLTEMLQNCLIQQPELRQMLVTQALPSLKSFLACRSCKQGGILTPHAQNKDQGIAGTCSKCDTEQCFHCDAPAHGDSLCDQQAIRQKVEFLKGLVRAKTSGGFGYCPHCDRAVIRYDGCANMKCTSSDAQEGDANGGCGATFRWSQRKSVSAQLQVLAPEWWQANQKQIQEAEAAERFTTAEVDVPQFYHQVYENVAPPVDEDYVDVQIEEPMPQERIQVAQPQANAHARAGRVAERLLTAAFMLTAGAWGSTLILGPMLIHSAHTGGPLQVSTGLGLGLGIPLTMLSYGVTPRIASQHKLSLPIHLALSIGPAMFVNGLVLLITQRNAGLATDTSESFTIAGGVVFGLQLLAFACTTGTN